MQNKTIKAAGYEIVYGNDALAVLSRMLRSNAYQNAAFFLLADEHTHLHCWPRLVTAVPELENAELLLVESGEEWKNIAICTQLWRALSDLGADRQSVLINLGGGVIGDMGGFVAASFKRGIRFIHVPTTLLAMVDASIGGKVGIDLDMLKNQVGAFAPPEGVFIWPAFLDTLPEEQLLSGFAEMVKHALVADPEYWKAILHTDPKDPEALARLIPRSVEIKNEIVRADPTEKGHRKLLNFGHTLGHAFETWSFETGTTPILHGHAVAMGMLGECELSRYQKGFSDKDLETVKAFLLQHYRPVNFHDTDINRLFELMRHDKKNKGGKICFTLLKAIGEGATDETVNPETILKGLQVCR